MPVRIAAGQAPTRPLPPFHEALRELVDDLQRRGMSQHDIAERLLRVAPNTLECWLSSPTTTWHREPHYLTQVGTLTILRNLCEHHHERR